MAAKSLAQRAAELGTDEASLVRALMLLCRSKTVADKHVKHQGRLGGSWRSRTYKPMFSIEEAANLLAVNPVDVLTEIKKRDFINWNEKKILDAMFGFYRREGRWPVHKDMKRENGLPPRDTWTHMAWNGQAWGAPRVSPRDWWERKIARDKRCTPQMALHLRNVLARKEAIDRFGFQTFLEQGFATVLDEDPEYGTLYHLPGETPKEPMLMLKVVNSTPDPDGSFADYYLRVPPDMRTARDAVRWTFHGDEVLGSQPYAPLVQT